MFEEALLISPNHPGLNLNLVQTVIKKMAADQGSDRLLERCHQAFQRLNHVGENHKQFSRLQTLKTFITKYNPQDSA